MCAVEIAGGVERQSVDYILMLVQKYRDERGDGDDKELRAEITRAVDASPTLRNKKDLIEEFVNTLSTQREIDEEWRAYVTAKRDAELQAIITEEQLRAEEARSFIDASFREGRLRIAGTAITAILPPVSRFSATGGHSETKQRVIARLAAFVERFLGLGVPVVDPDLEGDSAAAITLTTDELNGSWPAI